MPRIKKSEIPKLQALYDAHKNNKGIRAQHLPDYDYLRGKGFAENGNSLWYGLITLTPAGVKFAKELFEEQQQKMKGPK